MNNFIKIIKINFKLTFVLIGLNLLAYALTGFFTAIFNNETYGLLIMGASYTPTILAGEVWRLISSSFLHGGLLHLGLNMYALYISGMYIEQFYGAKKLFTVYILSAFGASILSLLVGIITVWYTSGLDANAGLSVGASGAIFGMIGVLVGNKIRKNTYEPELDIDTNQLIAIIFYNLLIGFGVNFTGGALHIDNWAHLGGLIVGILLGIILNTVNNFKKSKLDKLVENALFISAIIMFFGSLIAQAVYIFITLFQ